MFALFRSLVKVSLEHISLFSAHGKAHLHRPFYHATLSQFGQQFMITSVGNNRHLQWAKPKWNDAPKQRATGWFRTQKVDGRWWLVTPDGRLFFSTGIDGIGPGGQRLPLQHRCREARARAGPDDSRRRGVCWVKGGSYWRRGRLLPDSGASCLCLSKIIQDLLSRRKSERPLKFNDESAFPPG